MCSILRLAVLVAIVGYAELITVKTPRKRMDVELGENALLECTFETTEADTKRLTIFWEFAPSNKIESDQMFYYQTGEGFIADDYKHRLEPPFSPGTTKNVSVLLRNMQAADSGSYTCEVRNAPDVDGKTDSTIQVTVLQEPSQPYCSIHGKAHLGQTVTLICHSEHGSPTPTYTWSRIGQAQKIEPTTAQNTGTLAIENITESDFGSYLCTSQNVAGRSTCNLELYAGATDIGTMDSNDVGYLAAIILGVLLGCVLIGVAVWLIVQAVNKKKYKGVRQTEGTPMSSTVPQ